MVLFDVPTDISLCILRTWLGKFDDLSRLDVACAPSVRQAFLDLIRDPSLTIPDEIDSRSKRLPGLTKWMNARLVKFESLRLRMQCAMNPDDAAHLQALNAIDGRCLANVSSFRMRYFRFTDVELFRVLLLSLPSLTSLQVEENLADDGDYLTILAEITHIRLTLLELDHDGDESYGGDQSCPHLSRIFVNSGNSLRILNLGHWRLDDTQLALLSQVCKNINELMLCLLGLSLEAILRHFASADDFPRLERLVFRSSIIHTKAVLPADTLIRICKKRPQLKHFSDWRNIATDISSCAVVLSLCPQMEVLQTCTYMHSVSEVECGCDFSVSSSDFRPLEVDEGAFAHALSKIAACRKLPITGLRGATVGNIGMTSLLTACGKWLRIAVLTLLPELDGSLLLDMATICTALERLTLHASGYDNLNDGHLMALARNCPDLVEFHLYDCLTITDDGMEGFLRQVGARLIHLDVVGCNLLTNNTLQSVVSYCPLLKTFSAYGTSITARFRGLKVNYF